MTTRRTCRPVVTQLEDRAVPAINVLFDFRFDATGFFTGHADRIATIQAAAADVGARFTDTLNAIPFPTAPGDSWTARFDDPSALDQEEVTNLIVPANTVVVFVGARDLLGELTEESSERVATGSPIWYDQVFGRGQANSYGAGATDFSPWGGSITYDLIANWHFGIDPPGGSTEYDLYMATQKALFHILGFGESEAWSRIASGGQFFGPQAVAVNGGAPVPLVTGDDGEPNYVWAEDTLSQGQRTLMDRDLEDGERIAPTALDLAAMTDIGWKLQSTSPPPPAAPPPPIAPPAPIAPGTALLAVGSGAGGPTQFTVNAAASFTQLAAFNPYPSYAGGAGFTGGVRVATADVNLDGVEDIIVGPGPGTAAEIKVYSGANFPTSPDTSLIASGYAFETSFLGGVFVSVGDINKDGVPDLVVTPDEGGGPRVRIVSGKDRTIIADFLGIDDASFRGGARTAVGDLNNDGNVDLVVAAGFGGGPRVAVFDGKSLRPGGTPTKLINDFFLFEQELRNGAYVAVGDLNGDGYGDLIGGGGPGGGPRVYALSGFGLTQQNGTQTVMANFFAGDTNNRGGVPVAVKNIDGDQRADIVAGAGSGGQAVVTTYLGSTITPTGTPAPYQRFLVFDSSFLGGAYVG
ncbi:MAG: VCBS repeat-containing protein [Gemmataceae bacterium]